MTVRELVGKLIDGEKPTTNEIKIRVVKRNSSSDLVTQVKYVKVAYVRTMDLNGPFIVIEEDELNKAEWEDNK